MLILANLSHGSNQKPGFELEREAVRRALQTLYFRLFHMVFHMELLQGVNTEETKNSSLCAYIILQHMNANQGFSYGVLIIVVAPTKIILVNIQ
eukprot:850571-Amphidinium_carterae.1